MKKWHQVVAGLMAALGGLILSGLITWAVWESRIGGKAFQCNDGPGLGAFWVSMDDHRNAGDAISPRWTWEKLKEARADYEIAFYWLWFLSGSGGFLAVMQMSRRIAKETVLPCFVAGESVETNAATK